MNNTVLGILITLFFVTLTAVFCILIIRLYIRKIQNYTRVLYQKDIDFQKTLNSAIIETQEQVLNNISRDLHDDAGQQLTAINFSIENLKLDSPALKADLEPLSLAVGRLAETVRDISHSLNDQLSQQNLISAIETEIRRLKKNARLRIRFTLLNAEKVFTTDEKIVIYRIFQECINNTLKHSKAQKLQVSINTMPEFTMRISDDGKGFDYNGNNNGSMGLSNMLKRAGIIGYTLQISSTPGEGTTVLLSEKAN